MSLGQVGGALVVLLGFVLVNLGNREDILEQAAAAAATTGHHSDDHNGALNRNGGNDTYLRISLPPDHLNESERGQEVVALRNMA